MAATVAAAMNSSAAPCRDFHKFACGGWPSAPAHRALRWNQATVYSLLRQRNERKLERLLAAPVLRAVPWSAERKLKSMFRSCLDEYLTAKLSGRPLIEKVLRPAKCGDGLLRGNGSAGANMSSWDFNAALRKSHVDFWIAVLFDWDTVPSHANPNKRNVIITSGGLGMRVSGYLDRYENSTLYAYRKYMARIGDLLMRDADVEVTQSLSADEKAQRLSTFVNDVIGFETKLANITRYSMPTPDPHATENQMTLGQLNLQAGPIDWVRFFQYLVNDARLGVGLNYKVVLESRDYIFRMADLINTMRRLQGDVVAWRIVNNYFVWRLAQIYSQELSFEYVHASREFYEDSTGRKQFPSTYEFCYGLVRSAMPEALGALFVRDHFADASRSKIHEMVGTLKASLKAQIRSSPWIDKKTQDVAVDKLDSTVDKLGYPSYAFDDNVLDTMYRTMKISRYDYFGNLLSINMHFRNMWVQYLVEGEDRSHWPVHMFDVHMSFSNYWNELLVPAGTMQWPLFALNLPSYITYGSMGTIMAHELIKAVDAWGGYYTKTGVFYDWWTNTTTNNYMKRRKCILDYYSNFTAGPYFVPYFNRRLSVPMKRYATRYLRYGIAETGGIRAALKAYRALVGSGEVKHLPGLNYTPEQLFFISYGQINCFTRSDFYSWIRAYSGRFPEDLRGNGALAQLDEFSKAFNCPASSPMVAKTKCNVF